MPPSVREVIDWNADEAAEQFVEAWDNSNHFSTRWHMDYANHASGSWSIQSNDGLMGSAFARVPLYSGFQATPNIFVDHTHAFTFRWRQRVPTPNWDGAPWQGQGVILSGEMKYALGAADGYGFFGGTSAPGGLDNVVDVEITYNPTTHQASGRWKLASGSWSSWDVHALDLSSNWWPIQWWSGGLSDNGIDLGRVAIIGRSIWGMQDFRGHWDWVLTNADVYMGADSSGICAGIYAGNGTRQAQYGNPADMITTATSGAPFNQSWGATSPTIGLPTGAKYSEFWFDCGISTEGTIHVRLRNAATDALISDSYLPGNSAGLETVATALAGSGGNAAIKKVSMAGIPEGVEVYVDVQGVSGASAPLYQQARLAGAWMVFADSNAPTEPTGELSLSHSFAASLDGSYSGPSGQSADTSFATAFAVSSDAVVGQVGSLTLPMTPALAQDAYREGDAETDFGMSHAMAFGATVSHVASLTLSHSFALTPSYQGEIPYGWLARNPALRNHLAGPYLDTYTRARVGIHGQALGGGRLSAEVILHVNLLLQLS